MKEFFDTDEGKIFIGMFIMSAAFWVPFGWVVWIAGAAVTLVSLVPVVKPYIEEKIMKIKNFVESVKMKFSFLKKRDDDKE